MHSLTISFGPAPMVWVLLYKTKDTAETAYKKLADSSDFSALEDDFGQNVSIKKASMHGVMLEDLDLSKMAHIEQALHRARTSAQANRLAGADPTLRTAAMAGGGPSVISPMNANGRGF